MYPNEDQVYIRERQIYSSPAFKSNTNKIYRPNIQYLIILSMIISIIVNADLNLYHFVDKLYR